MLINRRLHPRFPFQSDGRIRLLLADPALTREPYSLRSLDVSHGGMSGLVPGFPNHVYLAVLRDRRECSVWLAMPAPGAERNDGSTRTEFHSIGRIRWMDYNNRTQPSVLRLGVEFAEVTSENERILTHALTLLQNAA